MELAVLVHSRQLAPAQKIQGSLARQCGETRQDGTAQAVCNNASPRRCAAAHHNLPAPLQRRAASGSGPTCCQGSEAQ